MIQLVTLILNLRKLVQCLVSWVLNNSLPIIIYRAFRRFINHWPSPFCIQCIIFYNLYFYSTLIKILIHKVFSNNFIIKFALRCLRFYLCKWGSNIWVSINMRINTVMMSESYRSPLNCTGAFTYLSHSLIG